MRKVGIKEFRDNATKLLAAGETMLMERHGHQVGYFIPVKQRVSAEAGDAAARLAEVLERALNESGLSKDELAELFTLRRDRAPGRFGSPPIRHRE